MLKECVFIMYFAFTQLIIVAVQLNVFLTKCQYYNEYRLRNISCKNLFICHANQLKMPIIINVTKKFYQLFLASSAKQRSLFVKQIIIENSRLYMLVIVLKAPFLSFTQYFLLNIHHYKQCYYYYYNYYCYNFFPYKIIINVSIITYLASNIVVLPKKLMIMNKNYLQSLIF